MIEEQTPQSLIPAEPLQHQPIALPDDSPPPPRRKKRIARPGLLLIAYCAISRWESLSPYSKIPICRMSSKNGIRLLAYWFALLWVIVALLRRDVSAFIGGAVVAGLSISLLLDAPTSRHISRNCDWCVVYDIWLVNCNAWLAFCVLVAQFNCIRC